MDKKRLQHFGENYAEAWSSQKPENVASFFSDNGFLYVNNDPPLTGRNEITKFVEGFMMAFPDMKLVMDSLITKSDETQFHWTFTGTNTGPNGKGNRVKFSGVERWIFNKIGLIRVSKGSYDTDEYNRQLEHGTNN